MGTWKGKCSECTGSVRALAPASSALLLGPREIIPTLTKRPSEARWAGLSSLSLSRWLAMFLLRWPASCHVHCMEHVEERTVQISPLSANLLLTGTELGAREAPGGIHFLGPPRMPMRTEVVAQMGTLKEFTAGLSSGPPLSRTRTIGRKTASVRLQSSSRQQEAARWVGKHCRRGRTGPSPGGRQAALKDFRPTSLQSLCERLGGRECDLLQSEFKLRLTK